MNTTKHARFIEHDGVQLLHIDLSAVKTEEDAFKRITEAKQLIASQPHDSVRTLTDSRDSVFSRKVVDELRSYTKHNEPFVRASALVGVTGMQKVIYSAIAKFTGRTFKICHSPDEAMDWLAGQ